MMRYNFLLCGSLLVLFSLALASPAQKDKPKDKEKTKPGDEMIYKYLCAETDKLSKKFLDGAKTLDEWKKKRPRLHREYMYMLGLDPLPKKTPLKATITGTHEYGNVIVDNLHYQSIPGLYVTANLYRPKGNKKKLPTILYVCGHSNRGRDGSKSAYQDHGRWFAENGYNCLVLDTLQLGEIPGVHHGTYGVPYNHLARYGIKGKNKVENRWWWHCRGYTPAGVECWNGIRGIDYLLSRPDVDADRIGVTGISGGGAATFWIAAADERVKVAVPVSGMSDLESYVKNKVINGHCDCMFLYNTFQWQWTTIAALVAPRPLMFANSDNDRIFPMDGNRRIAGRLEKLYTMYGKPGNFTAYVSPGGHAYRPDLRLAIFKFINKHLKHDTKSPVKDADYKDKIPGKELRVFPTDADIPKDQINTKVDEVFVPAAKVELPEKGKFAGWKKRLVKELREKCFRAFPEIIEKARLVDGRLSTEPNIEVDLLYFHPDPKKQPTIVVADGNCSKSLKIALGSIKPQECYLFSARGMSRDCWVPQTHGTFWSEKSPPNYVERSHVLLGRTVDEGRVFDIISTLRKIDHPLKKVKFKHEWKVVGYGQAGILAAYAALFEPSIKEVVIINPPTSHKDGPYFLNVQRVLDIPEALGLLAPRVKLTLINAKDRAFDRTEQIYRIAGAAKMFERK